MTNHPPAEVLERFRRGALEPRELLEVDRHLAECETCALPAADAARGWDEALGGAHLTYDAMARYVDGEGAEDVEPHLAMCAMCRDEVDDLRAIAAPPRPARRWLPLAIAAALAGIALLLFLLMRPAPSPHVPVVTTTPAPPTRQTPPTTTIAEERPAYDPALRPIADALIAGVVPSADLLRALRPAAGRERGGLADAGAFDVVAPVGVVLDDDRPRFRWSGEARAFTVEIVDDRLQLVDTSGAVSANEWRPSRPLPRGRTLTWQVRREDAGSSQIAPRPPDPPARFRIIASAAHEEIRDARSPLEAALLYAREGMLEEARANLRDVPSTGEVKKMRKTLDLAASQWPRPTTMNGAQ